ncbi:MAG: GC-type dockerin domain-anchored protein [Planctomycetota bacterium]|nr:GC-type dockerin domain-anchored protein [Planctomycetota bacterium]
MRTPILCVLMMCSPALGQFSLERRFSSAGQVPDYPSGVTFSTVGSYVISNSGDVFVNCRINNPPESRGANATMRVAPNRIITTVLKGGSLQTGTPSGTLLDEFSLVGLAGDRVSVVGNLYSIATGNPTGRAAVYSGNGSPFVFGLQTGTSAVIASGAYISTFDSGSGGLPRAIVQGDDIVFWAQLAGASVTPATDSALVKASGGTFTTIAREGFPAPGFASGTVFGSMQWPVTVDATGAVWFTASVNGSETAHALFRHANGQTTLLLRGGQPATGAPFGSVFSSFGQPRVNARGEIALTAIFDYSGRSFTGIWAGTVPDLSCVLYVGAGAPGFDPAIKISGLVLSGMDNVGRLCFGAELDGPGISYYANRLAIYMGRPGSLRVVSRMGDSIESTLPNTTINQFIFPAIMNERGQAAVQAVLATNGNVSSVNSSAVILLGGARPGQILLRAGDTVSFPDGSSGALLSPEISRSSRGNGMVGASANDNGEFAIDCGVFGYGRSIIVAHAQLPCEADFNGDGFVDFTDFDEFVSLFEDGASGGDFNNDGFIDFTDFDAFVTAFEGGCN